MKGKRTATKTTQVAEALLANDEQSHFIGKKYQYVYQVKLVTLFLKAGIPLNKLEKMVNILEENAVHLIDCSHMSDLIPFAHEQEVKLLKLTWVNVLCRLFLTKQKS